MIISILGLWGTMERLPATMVSPVMIVSKRYVDELVEIKVDFIMHDQYY